MIQKDDLFQLLDISEDVAVLESPMTYDMMMIYVNKRFEEQPLKYFNLSNGLRVIHLRSKMIMQVKLKLEIQ
jgi:hypothetical protein